MLIHQLACIKNILTHCMLFIKAITHNKVKILDPSNRVPLGPFTNLNQFGSAHPYNHYITKQATKPRRHFSESKLNPNSVRDYPKRVLKFQPGLSENSPENSARIVQKQSRNSTRTVREQSQKFLHLVQKIWDLNLQPFTASKKIPSH